ncbi:hypothetical protein [Micromonospora sp. NPDC005172]|uniref:hypothetical protein n=1 Tax=Micromonospora sp. NPDC005172 TaxID=3156867 RepID=UPI0033A8EDF1
MAAGRAPRGTPHRRAARPPPDERPRQRGRLLVRADSIAPAEIRHRPSARDVVAHAARHPDAPPTITQLAINLGVL